MSLKLHHLDIGSSDEVILFLHGLGATSDSWSDQVDAFKDAYRLIIPDLRGHGQTPLGDEDFSFELCADDLYHLLEELNIDKVHLCGFSMGGIVAFEFAVKYPDKLHSFCVTNTLAHFKLFNFNERFKFSLRQLFIRILPIKVLASLMAKKLFLDKDIGLRQRLVDMSVHVNKEGYKKALSAMIDWDIREHLTFITVPSLIVGSEYDYEIFSGKKELAEGMPNARYVQIKDARHFVTWERADVFNRVYKEFISSV